MGILSPGIPVKQWIDYHPRTMGNLPQVDHGTYQHHPVISSDVE